MEKQILTNSGIQKESETSYRSILLVIRYPKFLAFLGFLSMALFHFPLYLNKKVAFYKLMGTGKNGSFDIWPDLQQWSVMLFYNKDCFTNTPLESVSNKLLGSFILKWLSLSKAKIRHFHLEPYAGHGTWDNHSFINQRKSNESPSGKIAVLTRATIRFSKLMAFWKAVPSTAFQLDLQPGFIYSVGIGEVPLQKQATFSIWETEEAMKSYAYKMRAHQEVIKRTRSEQWYAEEMFLRFKVLADY